MSLFNRLTTPKTEPPKTEPPTEVPKVEPVKKLYTFGTRDAQRTICKLVDDCEAKKTRLAKFNLWQEVGKYVPILLEHAACSIIFPDKVTPAVEAEFASEATFQNYERARVQAPKPCVQPVSPSFTSEHAGPDVSPLLVPGGGVSVQGVCADQVPNDNPDAG